MFVTWINIVVALYNQPNTTVLMDLRKEFNFDWFQKLMNLLFYIVILSCHFRFVLSCYFLCLLLVFSLLILFN